MAQAFMDRGITLYMTCLSGEIQETKLEQFYGLKSLPHMVKFSVSGRWGVHLYNLYAAVYACFKRVDLVVTRSVGAAAFCSIMRVPVIWECHAPPKGMEIRLFRLLSKNNSFKRLVVISEALKHIMFEEFPKLEKFNVLVAHDGVDLERFNKKINNGVRRGDMGIGDEVNIAGYSGHLYDGRGIDIVIACAQILTNWHFLIIGGDDVDCTKLRNKINNLKLSNITITGFIKNDLLPQYLEICDVLLMPYQKSVMVAGGNLDTVRWMSPLKMFEYMAAKKAIITSDLPVLREVMNKNNSVLVKPDQTSEWIEALEMLKNNDLRIKLGNNAYYDVQQYDWKVRVDKILAN